MSCERGPAWESSCPDSVIPGQLFPGPLYPCAQVHPGSVLSEWLGARYAMAVPTEPTSYPQPIPPVDPPAPDAATGGAAAAVAGAQGHPKLPPLPAVRGAGLAHVLIPATAVWLVALIAALFAIPTLRSHDAMLWLWTALAGWLLGFVGLAVYSWQRAAARRGSRGASTLALDEQLGSS
ncbi:MAG: DUF2530 domain-containing protein [Nakamurella sp.]